MTKATYKRNTLFQLKVPEGGVHHYHGGEVRQQAGLASETAEGSHSFKNLCLWSAGAEGLAVMKKSPVSLK